MWMQGKPWGKHNTHTIWFETMKHLQYSVHLVVVDKAEGSAWLIYAEAQNKKRDNKVDKKWSNEQVVLKSPSELSGKTVFLNSSRKK